MQSAWAKNNDLLVSFFRKALQDIRFLPRNPFTEWLEIDRQKTDFRITVLNVTIDDVDLIYDPFLPHFESMIEGFEWTYAHLKLEFPWFFRDFHEGFSWFFLYTNSFTYIKLW